MNSAFKSIYDAVVLLTGKRNSQDLIVQEIGLCTLEEHGARNYAKDYQTLSWMKGDDENIPLNPNPLEPEQDKYLISLNVDEYRDLRVWTQNHEWVDGDLCNDPRTFIPTVPVSAGIYVLKSGSKLKIRATEPILAYEFKKKKELNISPSQYDSWIGTGIYKSTIIHEVAYRLQFTIGDSSYRDNEKIALRNRKFLRTTEHHYN